MTEVSSGANSKGGQMGTRRIRGSRTTLAASLLVLVALASMVTVSGCAPQPGGSPNKNPVVLVNGFTGCNVFDVALEPLANRLRTDGYQAFIFGYDDCGFGDIRDNAARLSGYIDSVRASTGSAKVDIVGYSMGGLVSRYYIKSLGGDAKVGALITMGTPHYGTAVANIAAFFLLGNCIGITACQQMAAGSSFLNDLNAGPDAVPGVRYTAIMSVLDELVIPYNNGHVRDGSTYQNVTLQDQCPLRIVEHALYVLDGTIYDGIRDALRGQRVDLDCFAL